MIRIASADPQAVEVALSVKVDMPAVAVLGWEGDRVVGSGGLAWGGGRCWIWFKMISSRPEYAGPIVRATRQMLRRAVQLGERAVYTPRDAREPRSGKLLRLLGFEMLGFEQGEEIWVWRPVDG